MATLDALRTLAPNFWKKITTPINVAYVPKQWPLNMPTYRWATISNDKKILGGAILTAIILFAVLKYKKKI